MHTNSILSIKRLTKLISNDVVMNRKLILICTATIAVFFLFFTSPYTQYLSPYFFALYVGGFVLTSNAFNEMHREERACYYLTLPCSNLERFLSKWLLTTIFYALALLVFYTLFGFISFLMNVYAFGHHVSFQSPLDAALWWGIGKYMILQSVVLLGAAFFRKYVLIKTALCVGCFLLVVSILTTILAMFFSCPDCSTAPIFVEIMAAWQGNNIAFWSVIAPICLFLTYLRIRDRELG